MTPAPPVAPPEEAILEWPRERVFHRIYWRSGRDGKAKRPDGFAAASPGNRFDVPGERMLYAAGTFRGAVLETVLRPRNLDAPRVKPRPFVERRELDLRAGARLRAPRPLTLLKLMDGGLAALGLDSGISASWDYATTARLAAEFHAGFAVDGFAWRSRLDNGEVVLVLFESRVARPLDVVADVLLSDPEQWPALERVFRAQRCVLSDSGGPPPPLDAAG